MTHRLSPGACALVVLSTSACYSTEDGFIRRFAKLGCVNARECEPQAFDEAFDSMSDCRDEAEDRAHSTFDPLLDRGCEYIAENGRDCIHALYRHRKECSLDEVDLTDCDAVFVCPGGRELDEPSMSDVLQSMPD
ncbi:MAG TPA: hypothetical protein VG755_31665 [Nannocystaceae bacterium]|nr:hypothetical protein [Nannocystaceae bacterium]